ncbi:substrate binding domain-containing protein [Pseudoalteromonas fenneropenaei]|uniref:Substrate binding domain-containing protein n=1 Tax=Pseudoalteromonas fenneropenaei TaxID=1737459 RepID=A0ABV7CES2_9GAMM
MNRAVQPYLRATLLLTTICRLIRTLLEISLDIHLGDEDVDLVEQGFDLGFRAASRPFDSAYIGRPLRKFNYHICAAPSYLAKYPAITQARDLLAHNCFEYSYFKGKNVWPLADGVKLQGNLKVNNVLFMLDIVKAGHGIGFLPEFTCREALAKGEVIEVLAEVAKPHLTLYALYPARQFVPPKVLQCITFLEHWFTRQNTVQSH